MKHILYIGNKLSGKGKTATTIDTLGKALEHEGFLLKYASSKKNKLFRFFDMLASVYKNRKEADYVLIDTYSTLNFYYAYAVSYFCQALKLKYIPILHGGDLPKRLESSAKMSALIFNNAHVNIAPSEYIKTSFNKKGYNNLEVIPNSIDIKNYLYKERKIEDINLLWVRSFSELYNPNLAIDVLHELIKKGEKATLCMIGPDNDGSLQKAKDYAKSLNVEVRFTGKLSKTDWISLAKDYNVFLNTTNFDNMPVSVIEAMALGIPVISTNVGGLPYLIEDKKNGILVEPNNKKDFVNTILDFKQNPYKVEQIAINARKKTEEFSWNIVRKHWLNTLA